MIILCMTKSVASEADQPIILTTTAWDNQQTYTTRDARPILNIDLKKLNLTSPHRLMPLKQANFYSLT